MSDEIFAAMQEAWGEVAPRFQAYKLVLPGTPRFICQPSVCTAYCCHAYSVGLSDADVARMSRFENLEPVDFLELDEDGTPVTLPMAQPFLLARADNHCKMLGADLGCGAYHGRPNACRLYPHFVVFWDAEAGRARTNPSRRVNAAFDAAAKGKLYGPTPLLLGHSECPGFTGDPISESDWWSLFTDTYQLQYLAV
ncbi:MAG: YkgJ family cysteine cluster protein [bacterium]